MDDVFLGLALLFGPTIIGLTLCVLGALVMGFFYDGHGGWCMPWNQPND